MNERYMKLYLLTQSENRGYDTYDSCVVCAESEEDAKTIHPSECRRDKPWEYKWDEWATSPDKVECQELGESNDEQERGLILASFNAG